MRKHGCVSAADAPRTGAPARRSARLRALIDAFTFSGGLEQHETSCPDPGLSGPVRFPAAEGLRRLCDENGSLLIFDEGITGFRLSCAGAAGYFGVQPDLMTFGKIIGAGMPVGAYGGRPAVMEMVSPLGPVYQAGTLSGNPVAMAAGLAQLTLLRQHPGWYETLNETAGRFFGAIQSILSSHGRPYPVNHLGSLGCIFFTQGPVTNHPEAKTVDTEAFGSYCRYLLDRGIYCAPSQFEAMFLSMAHGDEELNRPLDTIRGYFREH